MVLKVGGKLEMVKIVPFFIYEGKNVNSAHKDVEMALRALVDPSQYHVQRMMEICSSQ